EESTSPRQPTVGSGAVQTESTNARAVDAREHVDESPLSMAVSTSNNSAHAATGVTGQVLALDGTPLAGVTLSIGARHTDTGRDGRFVLHTEPTDRTVLVVDGGHKHGLFEAAIAVLPGRMTPLPYTIWLPTIDWAHAVKIAAPTSDEIVVTTPAIPDLEL